MGGWLAKRGLLLGGIVAILGLVVLVVWLRKAEYDPAAEPPASVKASPPGWEIRYQAVLALARRGSLKLPLERLAEMLDENIQLKTCRVQLKGGRDVPNAAAARSNIVSALKELVHWHRNAPPVESLAKDKKEDFAVVKKTLIDAVAQSQKQPREEIEQQLKAVYDAIARLTESSNPVVRTEALRTQKTLGL